MGRGSLTLSPLIPASADSPAWPCRTRSGHCPGTHSTPGCPGMGRGGSHAATHRQPRLPFEVPQRGEDAEVAGLARVPLGWQQGTAQGLRWPRRGWHGGSPTHLVPFRALNAGIALGRESGSWALLRVPQPELGTSQPSPCHLPCPLWVPRGRGCPGKGETEGTSGVLRCQRCCHPPAGSHSPRPRPCRALRAPPALPACRGFRWHRVSPRGQRDTAGTARPARVEQ